MNLTKLCHCVVALYTTLYVYAVNPTNWTA